MHASVMQWVPLALDPSQVVGGRVLEVGAYDVNGSVRPCVEALSPAGYVGVDQQPGPGVDVVCDAAALVDRFGPDAFDVVISTEMLEHAADWRACLTAMVRVLKPGGQLLLTTRGPGFGYHPYPEDHWRFTAELMAAALRRLGLDGTAVPDPDPSSPGVFVAAVRTGEPGSLDDLHALPVSG